MAVNSYSLHQEKIMPQNYFSQTLSPYVSKQASPLTGSKLSVDQETASGTKFVNAVKVKIHEICQYLSTITTSHACKADQNLRVLCMPVPQVVCAILHAKCSPISSSAEVNQYPPE